jgi:hypothetical protein
LQVPVLLTGFAASAMQKLSPAEYPLFNPASAAGKCHMSSSDTALVRFSNSSGKLADGLGAQTLVFRLLKSMPRLC